MPQSRKVSRFPCQLAVAPLVALGTTGFAVYALFVTSGRAKIGLKENLVAWIQFNAKVSGQSLRSKFPHLAKHVDDRIEAAFKGRASAWPNMSLRDLVLPSDYHSTTSNSPALHFHRPAIPTITTPVITSPNHSTLANTTTSVDLAALFTGANLVPVPDKEDDYFNSMCIPRTGKGRRLSTSARVVKPRMSHMGFDHVALFDNKSRLAFCNIPKNACSEMRQLFLRLIGRPKHEWVPQKYGLMQGCVHLNPIIRQYYRLSSQSVAQIAETLSDSRVFKAVFLRDPVERFKSAFSSKIAKEPCSYICGRLGITRKEDRTVSVVLSKLLAQRNRGWTLDWHFRSQADLCELKNLWPCYDFIGEVSNISSEILRFSKAVAAKLQLNLEPLLANGWGTTGAAPLFPHSGREGSGRSATPNEIVMVSHQNVEVTSQELALIKQLYADDYALIDAVRQGAHGSCNVKLPRYAY